MTIYGISGLGADERVFKYLDLPCKFEAIHWIKPLDNDEPISNYARRLAEQIIDDEFILIAVSFGGLIAVEMNKILKPKLTIIISSVETAKDLRTIYRFIGITGLVKVIPSFMISPPKPIMNWLFGAKNKKLLGEILHDTDVKFAKWAIIQLTSWKNKEKVAGIIKIHGTRDKMIPSNPDNEIIAIKNGEHFMIVDRAKEISQILKEIIIHHNELRNQSNL